MYTDFVISTIDIFYPSLYNIRGERGLPFVNPKAETTSFERKENCHDL